MGLRTGPTLCSHPCPATPAWGGSRGIWKMEDEDPAGGLVHCCPPHVAAAAAQAWGIYNPAPAAGGGGGGGGGGPRRGQADGAWQRGRDLQVAGRTGEA